MGWAHAGGTVLLRNVPTCETADAPGTFTAITRALTLVIAVPDCAEARNGSRRSVAAKTARQRILWGWVIESSQSSVSILRLLAAPGQVQRLMCLTVRGAVEACNRR